MADSPDATGFPPDYQPPPTCTSCGRPLGESSDDQPDWPGGPLCADCYQARQMDDETRWSEQDEAADEQ